MVLYCDNNIKTVYMQNPASFYVKTVGLYSYHCALENRPMSFAKHHFKLPPRCKWDRRSSGKLHNFDWELVTGVSGQPIGPIF
jgi:hypothetical protein